MKTLKLFLALFSIAFFSNAHAEIYKDFTPNLSLKEIKNNYPNAKFETINAAWLKENEVFINLTGVGIVGEIKLKLSHIDDYRKKSIADYEAQIAAHPDESHGKLLWKIEYNKALLAVPLDERLTLDWVRWIPPEAIPYERIIGRYGNPDKCDFQEDTFEPYCSWESRGLEVVTSDNKKYVLFFNYFFTDADISKSYGLPIETEPQAPATSTPKSKETKSKKKSKK